MLSQGHGLDLLEFCHYTGWRPSFCTIIDVHVCFQTLTSALKELTLATQPQHVPTLRGHMSAPATPVTMEMEQNVKVSQVLTPSKDQSCVKLERELKHVLELCEVDLLNIDHLSISPTLKNLGTV